MNLFQNNTYDIQALTLLDEKFLATLSEQKNREIYAKIISLDINENPVDQIEGRVTTGSINIDGNSAIRRTCSLTLVTDQVDINDFYWGIKTKFKLEIGLCNKLTGIYAPSKDSIYPDIVWFPQGYYLVSTFNTSISTNNATISLSGKDKMCLLNGDLGGQLYASIDFGTEEIVSNLIEQVNLITNVNSESIILKDYYIKPDTSLLQQDDSINSIIKKEVLITNPLYFFILNKTNGNYYKDENKYKLVSISSPSLERFNRYDMYKKIENPTEELYEQIDNIVEYQKSTFYYKNEENHYVIDNATSPNYNRQYYKTNNENLPVILYQPNQFYYKKSDSSNQYFILDINSSITENRIYYKLVPLYQKFTNITKRKINIEKIIREAVHTYAKEPYYNIIINDLDDYGLEQLTYKGDQILYALYEVNKDEFTNLVFQGKNEFLEEAINSIIEEQGYFNFYSTEDNGTPIYLNNKHFYSFPDENRKGDIEYTIFKIEYGTDIGYRLTDLTYPGDLISNVGDTLTSVLDKIKNMLGDFEYFYDVNGKFIFQKKKTYVNTSWSQITNNTDETYVDFANNQNNFSFNFEGNRLISAIQNSPVLNNLKNDFIVWGKRKGVSGVDIPIHARFAIDKKPVYYKALNNKIYTVDKSYAIQHANLKEEDFTVTQIENEIKSFKLQYSNIDENGFNEHGLTAPKSNGDGTWTPGWWDIRDWARYYKLLTNTEEDPCGTMKFYSSNDENGCVLVSTLRNLQGLPRTYQTDTQSSVWLIEVYKNKNSTQIINLQHGVGIYDDSQRSQKYYYESVKNADGTISYIKTDITQQFASPYKTCSDTHTYLYFLDKIYDNPDEEEFRHIYFYNPQFPLKVTPEELIEERISEDYISYGENCGVYIVDWREIIYQMALDYFAGQGCSNKDPLYIAEQDIDNETGELLYEDIDKTIPLLKWVPMTDPDHFLYEVGKRNPYYYPTGYTGYEQYYTDMQGFWRELYNPDYLPEPVYSIGKYSDQLTKKEGSPFYNKNKIWTQPLIEDYNIEYYLNPAKENIKLQRQELNNLERNTNDIKYKNLLNNIIKKYNSFIINSQNDINRLYWNRDVFEHPEVINFWIDFLDSDLELAQFAIPQVGDRTKVVNDTSKTTSVIYTDIPNFILYDQNQKGENGLCDETKLRREIIDKSGYKFIYLPKGFSQYFTISYRTASIKNKIDELLYQYGYCIENITITAIPIYYLQPNTRIFVQDQDTNINGEYIVSKITLPLTYNGTMSITASKAPERLY